MKYKVIGLLLLMPFLLTCNISSPFIDVLREKIDKDLSPAEVAPAGIFQAQATAYDSDTNQGTIQVNWETSVPTSDQNEAVFLYIRGKVAEQPLDTADGFEVYHGDLSVNNISINNIVLGDRYHFGIWTQDQYGNLSDPVYAQASVQSVTLNVISDLHYETSNSTSSVDSTHSQLYLGTDSLGDLGGEIDDIFSILIQFDNLSVTDVIQADLKLFTAEAASTGDIQVSALTESWSVSDNASTLSGKTATLYSGAFNTSDAGFWTKWDITTMAQEWEQNPNYGIRIENPSSTTAAKFRSVEDVTLPPVIEVYYNF